MGGEEFLVGCDSADCALALALALALAERLRQAVAACVPQVPGASLPGCTVSIGLSPVFTERAGWEPALREADRALYAAKQGGRNRVVLAAGFGLSA